MKLMKNTSMMIILLLFICGNLFAANYYVAKSGGNDAAAGTIGAPWASIAKVNSFTFASNDNIYFERGGTYVGAIVVSRANLNYGAYGTGAKPIITGLKTITGWVNLGGNIWEAPTVGVKVDNNLVLRNGIIMQVGRFPNANATKAGYLTYTAATTSSITGPALSTKTNWTGAEVAIRIARWEILRKKVTSHINGVVSFAAHSSTPKINFGYFFQRDSRTLDLDGEWWQDGTKNKLRMYFSNNNPLAYTIQASTVDTLLTNMTGPSTGFWNNVTVRNLSFVGSGKKAVFLRGGVNHQVRSCDFINSGYEALSIVSAVNIIVDSCTAKNSLGSGILVSNNSNTTLSSITNCTVDSTSLIVGMETSNQNNGGEGIINRGGNNIYVQYNRVTNSGYSGVAWFGNDSYIKYNLIDKFNIVRDDGAGIYTSESQTDTLNYLPRFNRNVVSNIVINGVGQGFGTDDASNKSACNGIYVDDGTYDVLVDSNTVAYIPIDGFHGNNNRRINYTNNTVFSAGYGFLFQRLGRFARTIAENRVVKNIFYPYRFRYYNVARDVPNIATLTSLQNIGTIDSNYYSLRTGIDTSLKTVTTLSNGTGYIEQNLPFSYITGTVGDETHSTNVLTGGVLEYNASNIPRVVSFPGLSKKDIFGNVYINSVTIAAWKSIILIPV